LETDVGWIPVCKLLYDRVSFALSSKANSEIDNYIFSYFTEKAWFRQARLLLRGKQSS